MKKILTVFVLIFCMTFMQTTAAETATIYTTDGRIEEIPAGEREVYLSLGWYDSYAEVTKTLYAPDGRQITVWLSDVEKNKAVGWYENYVDVTKTLYAPDGRQITVWLSEVEKNKAVGWYENYADVTKTLYASGNRQITVWLSEVATYLALGWYETDPTKPMIALTFDDGPNPKTTPRIIETLASYGARATFFTLGNLAYTYPDILKRATECGCEIGSHTYSHSDMTKLSEGQIKTECQKTAAAIRAATGKAPALLRPPYGSANETVRTAAGMPLIIWNVDTRDWATRSAQKTADHILSHVSDGDIILMHDIYSATADAVALVVPELQRRGFQMVTVSELFALRGQTPSAGTLYYSIK